jgi:hypothetical protein
MSMMKAQSAKAPAKTKAKTPAKAPAKAAAKAPVKAPVKAAAKPTAKAPVKAAAKPAAKAPAKRKSSRDAMLARVEEVRLMQREEGHFDCFGRAGDGYCDQGGCSFHAECLSVSRMIHSM